MTTKNRYRVTKEARLDYPPPLKASIMMALEDFANQLRRDATQLDAAKSPDDEVIGEDLAQDYRDRADALMDLAVDLV